MNHPFVNLVSCYHQSQNQCSEPWFCADVSGALYCTCETETGAGMHADPHMLIPSLTYGY